MRNLHKRLMTSNGYVCFHLLFSLTFEFKQIKLNFFMLLVLKSTVYIKFYFSKK